MGVRGIRKDLSGKLFGYIKVIRFSGTRTKVGVAIWDCICTNCGKEVKISGGNILRAVSCGCWKSNLTNPSRENKVCSKCRENLPISSFGKNKSRRDGHSQFCKGCVKLLENKYREAYRPYRAEYSRNRRKTSIQFRLADNLRRRVNGAIRKNNKSHSTLKLIGCSVDSLISYLETKFTKDMSWTNYGEYWEIDHIKPCASFDLSIEDEQNKCFHYTNLQPLRLHDNRSKNSFYGGVKHEYK